MAAEGSVKAARTRWFKGPPRLLGHNHPWRAAPPSLPTFHNTGSGVAAAAAAAAVVVVVAVVGVAVAVVVVVVVGNLPSH